MPLELELPNTRQAPRTARRELVGWLDGELDAAYVQTAELLVSELVTNAVVHGRGAIELHARLDDECLFVEVTDEGTRFDRTVRLIGGDAVGGRGLVIVDAYATRWGIDEHPTRVWFELGRNRGPSG